MGGPRPEPSDVADSNRRPPLSREGERAAAWCEPRVQAMTTVKPDIERLVSGGLQRSRSGWKGSGMEQRWRLASSTGGLASFAS